MNLKIISFTIGIISIIIGVVSIISDNDLLYSGGRLLAAGILLIGFSYILNRGPIHTFICTECRKVSFKKQIVDNKCSYCEGPVQCLDGFYERHPELKNMENKKIE